MRILVTGASGFVGAALCRNLLARGHAVRAVVRRAGGSPAGTQARELVVEDIAGEFDRRGLLEETDVVVHLAAVAHRNAREEEIRRVNLEATVRLAEAAAGSVRRFVFMSSIKVHGEDSGERAYDESQPGHPQDAYARSKLDAERALTDIASRGGMELVMLRPPLVYGPAVRANFLRLLRWVDAGLPLPFASVHNRRSLIYLENLVGAIVGCVEQPSAAGPFLVSDHEVVSTPELLTRVARALERPARLVPVPAGVLRLAGAIIGLRDEIERLTGNLVVDASRARRVLGWRPTHSLDRGLAETARWYRSDAGPRARSG